MSDFGAHLHVGGNATLPDEMRFSSVDQRLAALIDNCVRLHPRDRHGCERALHAALLIHPDLMWEFFRSYHIKAFSKALGDKCPHIAVSNEERMAVDPSYRKYREREIAKQQSKRAEHEAQSAAAWKQLGRVARIVTWWDNWVLSTGVELFDATAPMLEAEAANEINSATPHLLKAKLYTRIAARLAPGQKVSDLPANFLERVKDETYAALPPAQATP